jgi:DNA-binding NarL/FixJ family response regulator
VEERTAELQQSNARLAQEGQALRQVQEEAANQLRFETLIADLSSKFVNLPAGEVDREIEGALRRVCEFIGIDLGVLWQWWGEAPAVATPMPGLDGLEAARRLKQAGCRSRMVFLTVHEDADYAAEALALGADAYVVKSLIASDLMLAISHALAGRTFVSATITLDKQH